MPSAPQPSAVAETVTLATAGEVDSLLRALARAPAPSRSILPELQPGERLGHYQVIERLGQGSMGVVYRALDIKLARDVALKLVATATAEASDELRQVAREAQALAALTHPNVVTVYSLEATEGVVFITMALVAGESLRQRMGGGPLARAEVLRGARELARGLAAAHARGIVHRDVKPENVRIDPSGNFVLLDFGLARFTAHDSAPPSARPIDPADSNVVTAIAGTPAYMAPEQRRGEPIDARVDVWALGLVILEMATGRRDREPSDLDRLPRALRAVVARCLELEPAQRFSDAGTLLEALEPRARRGPIVASVVLLATSIAAVSSQLTRDPCALPDDLLVGLWDREARERIDAGFARSELGYAADAREEVSDELGRYIDAWTGERRALCEGAQARDERFEDTREHLCLERLLHRAGRLSESFQRAEAATVTIAPELIAELPPPRTCAERPSTATTTATATPAADQAQVFALEDRISAARQLGAAGDEAGAIAQIDAAITDAAALGDDTGHIRALLAKAKIGAAFPDPTPALEAAHAAIGLATRLGEEESVGEALTVLAKVHTDHAQYDKAEAVGELARRVLQETGASHQRIALAEALGELAIARERWDDALAQLEPARAQAVELYGADHLVVAELDQELAWANGATQHDAAAADRYYAHALAVYVDHYGERHPAVGVLYNDIGVLAYQRNEYSRAEESFARALAIYRDAWGPRHPESLTTLANVANAANMRGDTERAITLGREVLALRAEVLGPGSVDYAASARDLAIWLRDAGRYDEALPLIVFHYETTAKISGEGSPQTVAALARVVDFALVEGDVSTRARYGPKLHAGVTTVPEDHPRLEYVLGVMSLLTRHEGDAAASLEFGERRVAWLTERAGARSPDTALAVSNVGTALLELGRPQEARLRLREALAILEADRTVSPLDYEFLVLPLAQAELELGERESARGRLLSLLGHEEIPRRPRLHAEIEILLAKTTDDPEERGRRAAVAFALIESGRAPRSLLVDVEPLRSASLREPEGLPRLTAGPESAVGSSAATGPSGG